MNSFNLVKDSSHFGLRVDFKSPFPPPLNLANEVMYDGARFGLGFDCSDWLGEDGNVAIRGHLRLGEASVLREASYSTSA